MTRTVAILCLFLLSLGGAAQANTPITQPLSFVIERNGDRIGTQQVAFERDGKTLRVTSTIDITVRIAFITAYRYTSTRRETWRDGRLVAYDAETDDDGTILRVRVRPQGDRLIAEGPEGRVAFPADAMAATFWNADTIDRSILIDPVTGQKQAVSVARDGEETIEAGNGTVVARRYRLSGDIDHTLWYDAAGKWLKLRLTGRDGSTIEYRAR